VLARAVGAPAAPVLGATGGSTPLLLDGVVATVVEPVVSGVEPVVSGVVVALVPGDDVEVVPGEAVPLGTVVVVTAPGSTVNGAEKTFGAVKSF
jgi:hypothetical protein